MCKIMILAGIQTKKTKRLNRFITAATKVLTAGSDRHGFGYSAVGPSGLYGEKWLNTADAFKTSTKQSFTDRLVAERLEGMVELPASYASFGKVPKQALSRATTICLHARYATNGAQTIHNTHPFYDAGSDTALIHNGVLSNQSALKNYTSSCDSECILNEYVENNVSLKPNNIQDVAYQLEGYYACGVIGNNDGEYYVDVFKDTDANLFAGYIREFKSIVFCTDLKMLQTACRYAGVTLSSTAEVSAGYLVRLDAVSGKRLNGVEFEDFKKKTEALAPIGWQETDPAAALREEHDANEAAIAECYGDDTEFDSRYEQDDDYRDFPPLSLAGSYGKK